MANDKSTVKILIAPHDHKIFPLFMRMSKSQHKKSESGGKYKKRHTKFVSFVDAQWMVKRAQLHSRKQFWEWIDSESIAYIPKMPQRVYTDDWVSWNDFLGVNNQWISNKKDPGNYRPYWDAVRWSQDNANKNDLHTMKEWLAWYGDNDVPDNIPKRPDAYYDEWAGWGTWLGNTIKGRIMTEKKANGILALVVQKGHAKNVITMKLEKGGPDALEDEWKAQKELNQEFDVIKMFEYDPEKYQKFKGMFEMCSTAYEGQESVRLVQSLPNFLWDVEALFEVVS